MTFAINLDRRRRSGFTLLELLLVIGIIGLLAALLLPTVTRSWDRAIRLRTQSDLSAIATALEAYKNDFQYYPPITVTNSGAATLGKALLGPSDAAHYYTGMPPNLIASNTLQNDIDAFAAGKNYQAGDVVLSGNKPTFANFIVGRQAALPAWNVFVCVRNNTAGHSPTGTATDFWWTPFLPYDGADGFGIRPRLTSVTTDATGGEVPPHATAGRVYGPYLDPDRFKTNGPVILDRWGSPILYFTTSKSANPSNAGEYVNRYSYPRVVGTSPETLSFVNANDNLGAFANEQVSAEPAADLLAKMRIMLGDYNVNGQHDADEPSVPTTPFLLWTPGADKLFGPRGNKAGTYSPAFQDFYTDSTHSAENATTASNVDDVTNFR